MEEVDHRVVFPLDALLHHGWESSASSAESDEEAVAGAQWTELLSNRRAQCGSGSTVWPSLVARELGLSVRPPALAAWERGAAHAFVEHTLPRQPFNKIFSQAWLDRDRFVTGSKDCRLALWTIGRDLEDDPVQVEMLPLPPPVRPMPREQGGIHALKVSPCGTRLAVGSSNPCEVAVLSIDSWKPRVLCVGHNDWVFGCDWVDEQTLWTGSRDKTLKVWRVSAFDDDHDDLSPMGQLQPGATLKHHADRVRAMRVIRPLKLAASLGSDRRLAMWDTDTGGLVRSTATRDREDLIALEADYQYGLIAAGGRDFVSFFDPRQEGIVHSEPSFNHSMGVRSISFRGNLMTVGGGMGRLCFYDLTAGAWHRFENNKPYRVLESQLLGAGGQDEFQAVYAHNWDCDGARLFAGGGPLMLQEVGSYASLYH